MNHRSKELKSLCFVALSVLFSPAPAKAAKAEGVKNFVPGHYLLVEGEESLCGSGRFYISENGDRIWLGPHYQFRTRQDVETSRSDLVIEKGCRETTEYKLDIKGRTTRLNSIDTINCKGKDRQTVINEATITKSKISLTQSSKVEPDDFVRAGGTPHSCVWKISKK